MVKLTPEVSHVVHLFIFQLVLVDRDAVVVLDFGRVDSSVPPGVPKDVLKRNNYTPKPESPVCQARTALDSNQGMPVNLTCKLTRKQQTVKFKSVSAGFPNHSYAEYRQGSTDTEDDDRSSMINV